MSATAILFRARANRLAALKRRKKSAFAFASVDNIFAEIGIDWA